MSETVRKCRAEPNCILPGDWWEKYHGSWREICRYHYYMFHELDEILGRYRAR